MFDFLDLLGLNNDLNDDLLANAEPVGLDLDGDGQVDAMVFQNLLDIDGDGIPDALITEQHLDLDGDGIVDTMQIDVSADLDLDGVEDAHSVLIAQDTDGDGEPDFMQTGEDFDGDGILDAVESSGLSVGDGFDTDGIAVNADAPAYVNFDPADADPDCVVGDPVSAMDDWHWQETDCSCAVASQEFVLEELTGLEFEESVLRDLAEEHGWFDPYGGTPMDDVGNLLEHMGLRVERSVDNSIEDLEECLANGGEVIVGVDSSEIWMGQNDDFLFFPGMDADHAVQVIGIDRTNPDQPMVILNDPGCTNGCGAMLPMDVFLKSWEDSGCFMVEAYA